MKNENAKIENSQEFSEFIKAEFREFIKARNAAARLIAMPTAPIVTLTREEINALCNAVPSLAEFCEQAAI